MHGCRLTNKRPRAWWFIILAMLAGVRCSSHAAAATWSDIPDHDIVVLKLAPDGALEWTRVIDRGSGDAGKDLVALPDGGYAVAGQTSERRIGQPHSVLSPPRPLLVRLSPDGAVAWDRFVTDGFDVRNAVVPAGDGGTAVLIGNGTVVRFAPDGRTLWTRATGIPEASALVLDRRRRISRGRPDHVRGSPERIPPGQARLFGSRSSRRRRATARSSRRLRAGPPRHSSSRSPVASTMYRERWW